MLLILYNIKKTTEERRLTANKFIDMTGWVMKNHGIAESRITVVSLDKIINGRTYWNCKCECGNIFQCDGAKIRNGDRLSCGCLHQERVRSHTQQLGYIQGGWNKKYNQYDLNNDFGIGYFIDGEKFYFDTEDYDVIKDLYWQNNHGYATACNYNNGNVEYVYMHRLVIGAKNSDIIDHKDKNRLNNIKNNLRITNALGNARNAGIAKNNTSGITGVSYNNKRNRWIAQITVNYKNINLGSFSDKEGAIKARLQAESKYFKEFAPQRNLFKQYGILEDEFLDCK